MSLNDVEELCPGACSGADAGIAAVDWMELMLFMAKREGREFEDAKRYYAMICSDWRPRSLVISITPMLAS